MPEITAEPIVEKLPLSSHDASAERLSALRELFPEAFAEGALDCQTLQTLIGQAGSTPDTARERYGLSWAGKAEAHRAIQSLSVGTLRPAPEESVNFQSSENCIIEGDNLEVLKLLQKSYSRRVKMIYIDPPYNTGNEFIYPDNFREGLQSYLEYSGQAKGGVRQTTNSESSGRYHSNWLSMMYPRLFLARNLLKDDGVIFVSIDDHEVHNLRMMMDEIFGEENFVAQFAWQSRQSVQNDVDVSVNHEYIVAYCKARRQTSRRLKEDNANEWWTARGFAAFPLPLDAARFSNPDNDPRGSWKADPFDAPNIRPNLTYAIKNPKTDQEYWPPRGRCWRMEKPKFEILLKDNRIIFGRTGEARPQLKVFYAEKKAFGEIENTWFSGDRVGTTTHGTRALMEIFDGEGIFDNPKPASLIKQLMRISTRNDDIILDFFAGSGTTAQAVLELNAQDGGDRKFILVQLPEATPGGEYSTIAEITKERVRRVIARMNAQAGSTLPLNEGEAAADLGFKVFKLDSSNFKVWDGDAAPKDAKELAAQLELYAEHLLPERSQQDVLYELLLKSGRALSVAVQEQELNGQTVYEIAGDESGENQKTGALLICLADPIAEETLREMIARSPAQVLCLDAAFEGNDQLKNNIVLQMRDAEISFRTV